MNWLAFGCLDVVRGKGSDGGFEEGQELKRGYSGGVRQALRADLIARKAAVRFALQTDTVPVTMQRMGRITYKLQMAWKLRRELCACSYFGICQ